MTFKVLLFSSLLGFGAAQPALTYLGKDPVPLAICQGDCDNDAQCPGPSSCVERENSLPAEVEKCATGDSGSSGREETDYCNGVVPIVPAITKCQSGVEDLVGTNKVLTAQVCNLFGGVCYVNQVSLASPDCDTGALKINHGSCALFPIKSYKNFARGDANQQTVGGFECAMECSGGTCKFSGGCVSVQCSTGDGVFVGTALTGTGNSVARTKGIENTAQANTFTENTFAEITGSMKTFFLSRTGDYVGAYQRSKVNTAGAEFVYNSGTIPTFPGANYGPKPCPASTMLMSAATSYTADELRMCGSVGEWTYYTGVNLLMDKTMYVQGSGDSATGTNNLATTKLNIGPSSFLGGVSGYVSDEKMDDPRKLFLYSASTAVGDILLTSGTIVPAKSEGMKKPEPDIAGTWRTYGVVFYCTDYARTDLTTCAASNQAMFYVADPNPSPAFGASAGNIGAGGKNQDASGSVAHSSMGVALVMAMVSAMQV